MSFSDLCVSRLSLSGTGIKKHGANRAFGKSHLCGGEQYY